MAKNDDEIQTADYKTTKDGKKVRAHRIVFNKGEEDNTKLREESMTDDQKSERERIVKGMKKNYKGFVAKYGKNRAKSVMYATATKAAMKEESEIEEELKGDQHKLDKNKNGKLDKHDFKLLRKEESEQLDELSKDTVSKYKKRASDSWVRHASDVYDHEVEGGKKAPASTYRNLANRKKGYARADARLNKEETTMELNQEEFDHEALDKKYGKPTKATANSGASKSHTVHDGMVYHFQDPRLKAKLQAAKNLKKEEVELDEAHPFDIPKSSGMATSTKTKHDVKKTSTGTVYTKQRDADGMAKEFKRDPDEAKRGRGRPKKNSFSEAAEFLMALDEEMFDEFMVEGFDAFVEHYEQLDELDKKTLGNYINRASSNIAKHAEKLGGSKAGDDTKKSTDKLFNRKLGIRAAVKRLTK